MIRLIGTVPLQCANVCVWVRVCVECHVCTVHIQRIATLPSWCFTTLPILEYVLMVFVLVIVCVMCMNIASHNHWLYGESAERPSKCGSGPPE